MIQFILRRILANVPILLGMTLVVFVMADLMPGDAVLAMITDETPLSAELIAMRRGQMGLDQPLPVQYARWLGQLARGSFGVSYITGGPVAGLITGRIPATLQLAGTAIVVALVVGVTLGIVSALFRYSFTDYALSIFGFVGLSTPTFFLGMVLIYVFALRLKLFPTSGMVTLGEPYDLVDNLRHLVLPAVSLSLVKVAEFMRYTRASMLDVLHEDYMRTARSKGVSERVIIVKHGLRNALIPVITVLGLSLPVMLGGAVIIETVYQWPGIGLLYIEAVKQRDAPIVMGLALLTGVIVLVSNLLADIVYGVVDPRIRYE